MLSLSPMMIDRLKRVLLTIVLVGAGGTSHRLFVGKSSAGTVAVIAVENHQVVLAADSRAMIENEKHKDDDCKILVFGKDVIFVAVGEAHLEVTGSYNAVWDARIAARQSIAQVPRKNDIQAAELANALASSWGKAAVNFFQPVVGNGGKRFLALYGGNEIVESAFAVRGVNGTTAVSHALVTLDSATIPPQIRSDVSSFQPGTVVAMGYGTMVSDYYPHPKTESAMAQARAWQKSVMNKTHDEQLLSYVAQLVQWTIDAGVPEIGGHVDEAILDAGGAQWVRRKCNCVMDSIRGGQDTL